MQKKKQLKLSSDSNERIRKGNIFKDIKNLFSVKKEIDNSATKQILLLQLESHLPKKNLFVSVIANQKMIKKSFYLILKALFCSQDI